ncbi:hypothetical protein BCD67_20665 [Oscillatoriales cyanobacterium USR001]|nr:hypothetical protein BCD67_20665 [Oscillatoriales cyanobacterium USR001]
MLKINHPQVYIYSYQLSQKSETEANSIWDWVNKIWKHFSTESDTIFSKVNLGYTLLTKAQKFSHSNKIEGSLRFCRLDDSEGILVRIGSPETGENKDLEITEIKEFNPNNLIFPDSYQDWLGQTILIVYKSKTYQEPSKNDLRQVANECLKNLFPEASQVPSFYRDSELFNSHIFEYSSIQDSSTESSTKSQLQIFVYRIDDEIEKKLESILQPLFELFYYRHKITKAFIDSRKNVNLARESYEKIEQIIQKLENNLEAKQEDYLQNLKANIKLLFHESLEYQKILQYLEAFDNTINIHVYNYQQKLSEICDKCQVQSEELTTFNLFIEKTVPYIQRQIKGDLGYFQHGTNLIDTAIASIRGIVEIEQAESDRIWQKDEKDRDRVLQQTLQNNEIEEKKCDRNLQTIVAEVGVGIGAAGVAATASPYILQPNPKDNSYYLGISLLFSLVAGLIGVAIAARVMRHLQNQEKRETIHPIIKFILGITESNQNSSTSPTPEEEM